MRARCTRCDKPFCDACLAFTVNGTLWCEPCGNRADEASRPRWAAGLLLGGGIFGASTLVFIVIWAGSGRIFPFLVLGAWAAAILIGWNKVSPLRGTERPTIERRGRR